MKNRSRSLIALGAVGMLTLAGCGASGETATVGGGNDDQKNMTISVFNGWDEALAASELWKAVLEEKGYDVDLESVDAAAGFLGLSTGDYDVNLDVWLPVTHASYLKKYGDDIVELGAWNDESRNAIAVNADAPIDSLEELAANADLFGNRIVGIEPGAGLTMATSDNVIPGYGLEGMEYLTSSTVAMLAELTAATENGENIVVTLWEPHWAYGVFPLKNLEDPQGALGDTESIHTYVDADFTTDFPTASSWLEGFEMDLDTLYTLEEAMFVDYDGSDYAPIVAQWIEENQEYVDGLTS